MGLAYPLMRTQCARLAEDERRRELRASSAREREERWARVHEAVAAACAAKPTQRKGIN